MNAFNVSANIFASSSEALQLVSIFLPTIVGGLVAVTALAVRRSFLAQRVLVRHGGDRRSLRR